MKGTAINSIVGATIVEWINENAGLGYYIQVASGDLRMGLAFAIIILLVLLGLLLFYLVLAVERKIISWHISQRDARGGVVSM